MNCSSTTSSTTCSTRRRARRSSRPAPARSSARTRSRRYDAGRAGRSRPRAGRWRRRAGRTPRGTATSTGLPTTGLITAMVRIQTTRRHRPSSASGPGAPTTPPGRDPGADDSSTIAPMIARRRSEPRARDQVGPHRRDRCDPAGAARRQVRRDHGDHDADGIAGDHGGRASGRARCPAMSRPIARNRAASPRASTQPSPMPSVDATSDSTSGLQQHRPGHLARAAPSARSSASSRVRCATRIEKVLTMMKPPTTTAMLGEHQQEDLDHAEELADRVLRTPRRPCRR